jgi:hypothetical protein
MVIQAFYTICSHFCTIQNKPSSHVKVSFVKTRFKGEATFIFCVHIVNDHIGMEDVIHNAPIPMSIKILDYAKRWLQHTKTSFNVFWVCSYCCANQFLFFPCGSWTNCKTWLTISNRYYWLINNCSNSDVLSHQSSIHFLHPTTYNKPRQSI